AARAVSASSNRSLISRSSVAVIAGYYNTGDNKLQRNRASGGPGSTIAHRAVHRPHEDIHREAFDGEGGEAKVAGQGHFEDFDPLHDWHRVVPFCARPVIPELPQPAAQKAAQYKID